MSRHSVLVVLIHKQQVYDKPVYVGVCVEIQPDRIVVERLVDGGSSLRERWWPVSMTGLLASKHKRWVVCL